ncbi:MAG: hypothetical protein GF320_06465 [Armatimonadia bacterium]|nr:hypothetical protein [Armatimonadia bacterium]
MSMIGESVARQFDASFQMWRETIEAVPDGDWQAESAPELCPARWAYHGIQAAEFHCFHAPGDFEWDHPFGVNWATNDVASLPGKPATLGYLDEVARRVADMLRATSDRDFLETTSWGEHTRPGGNLLGHMLYVLRHNHQHLGELCRLLRERGIEQPDWQIG